MKMKVMLVGLGVLVFIFCSANLSRAAADYKYYTSVSAPSEHPWQHDDTIRDDFDQHWSPMIILPLFPTMQPIIMLIQNPSSPQTQVKGLQRATVLKQR